MSGCDDCCDLKAAVEIRTKELQARLDFANRRIEELQALLEPKDRRIEQLQAQREGYRKALEDLQQKNKKKPSLEERVAALEAKAHQHVAQAMTAAEAAAQEAASTSAYSCSAGWRKAGFQALCRFCDRYGDACLNAREAGLVVLGEKSEWRCPLFHHKGHNGSCSPLCAANVQDHQERTTNPGHGCGGHFRPGED
ncbi:MAG: hypothetical protein WC729_29210 [Sphingomonas sp.]|uniref:hypothetical protein n=1 Tax=Sphingomonas sp. TaxID=28214 RepID=UPI00356730E6